MSRAVRPAKSFSTDVRRLFRDLDDPSALRRNPILAAIRGSEFSRDVFHVPLSDGDIVDLVRSEIGAVLATLRTDSAVGSSRAVVTRQIRIFERAILAKEPWASISRDLGVSRRQFTRDKSKIATVVARRLSARLSLFGAASAIPVATAELNACIALAEGGESEAAVLRLESIARAGGDLCDAVSALSAAARICASNGQYKLATLYLRGLSDLKNQFGPDGPNPAYIRGVIALIESRLDMERGKPGSARRKVGASLTLLQSPDVNDLRGARSQLGYAQVELALQLMISGRFGEAESEYRAAIRAFDSNPLESVAARMAALSYLAFSLLAVSYRSGEGARLLSEVRAMAAQNGLVKTLIRATMFSAQHLAMSGEFGPACGLMRNCIRLVNHTDDRGLRSTVCVATAELLLINPGRTLRDIEEARSLLSESVLNLPPRHPIGIQARWLLADAELGLGNPARSREFATSANDAAACVGSPRLRAATLRYLAEAESRLGNGATALSLIQESLSLADQYATQSSLALCYAAAARITGQPAYLWRARECCSAVIDRRFTSQRVTNA